MAESKSAPGSMIQRGLDAVLSPFVVLPNAGFAVMGAAVGATSRLVMPLTQAGENTGADPLLSTFQACPSRLADEAMAISRKAQELAAQGARSAMGQSTGDMPAAAMATMLTGFDIAALPLSCMRSETSSGSGEATGGCGVPDLLNPLAMMSEIAQWMTSWRQRMEEGQQNVQAADEALKDFRELLQVWVPATVEQVKQEMGQQMQGLMASINLCPFGPSGGVGGEPYMDQVAPEFVRIAEIRIQASQVIDSIQIVYVHASGQTITGEKHGGNGGAEHVFQLDPDDYVTEIRGRSGDLVDMLQIVTHKTESPEYGNPSGGVPFTYKAPDGYELIGFHGRSGDAIDQIGVLVRLNLRVAGQPAPMPDLTQLSL